MSWFAVGTAVVGGAMSAKGAQDAADAGAAGQENAAAIIREAAKEAKKTIFDMAPIAEQNYQMGTQAGLNVLGQSIAPQSQLARGGNIAAQQQLIAGLGQQQNALLGRPVDMSQLQTYQGGAIPDINYQLPEFQSAIPESYQQIKREIEGDVTGIYQHRLGRDPTLGEMEHYTQYVQPSDMSGAKPKRVDEMSKELKESDEGQAYRKSDAGKAYRGVL